MPASSWSMPTSTTPSRRAGDRSSRSGARSSPTRTPAAVDQARRADTASGTASTSTPAAAASRRRSSSSPESPVATRTRVGLAELARSCCRVAGHSGLHGARVVLRDARGRRARAEAVRAGLGIALALWTTTQRGRPARSRTALVTVRNRLRSPLRSRCVEALRTVRGEVGIEATRAVLLGPDKGRPPLGGIAGVVAAVQARGGGVGPSNQPVGRHVHRLPGTHPAANPRGVRHLGEFAHARDRSSTIRPTASATADARGHGSEAPAEGPTSIEG